MTISKEQDALLTYIQSLEAPEGWDQVYSKSKILPPKKLTSMTIGEVLKWQDENVAAGSVSSAAGGLQIIRKTLRGLVEQGYASLDEQFSEETQRRLGVRLLKWAGWEKYQKGHYSVDQFGNRLANTWAALPRLTGPDAGKSAYHGVAGNRALTDTTSFRSAIAGSWVAPKEVAARPEPEAPAVARGFRYNLERPVTQLINEPTLWQDFNDPFQDSGPAQFIARQWDNLSAADDTYVGLDHIPEGQEQHWRTYRLARSPKETEWIRESIRQEEKRRLRAMNSDRIIAPFLGALTAPESVAAAIFLPGAGVGIMKGAVKLGGGALASELPSEILRQQEMALATKEEGFFRVGAATILGAGLGAGIGGLSRRMQIKFEKRVGEEFAAMNGVANFTGQLKAQGETFDLVFNKRMVDVKAPDSVLSRFGVYLDQAEKKLYADIEAITAGFIAKEWRKFGIADDVFKNPNEWAEFLIRLEAQVSRGGKGPQGGGISWRAGSKVYMGVKELKVRYSRKINEPFEVDEDAGTITINAEKIRTDYQALKTREEPTPPDGKFPARLRELERDAEVKQREYEARKKEFDDFHAKKTEETEQPDAGLKELEDAYYKAEDAYNKKREKYRRAARTGNPAKVRMELDAAEDRMRKAYEKWTSAEKSISETVIPDEDAFWRYIDAAGIDREDAVFEPDTLGDERVLGRFFSPDENNWQPVFADETPLKAASDQLAKLRAAMDDARLAAERAKARFDDAKTPKSREEREFDQKVFELGPDAEESAVFDPGTIDGERVLGRYYDPEDGWQPIFADKFVEKIEDSLSPDLFKTYGEYRNFIVQRGIVERNLRNSGLGKTPAETEEEWMRRLNKATLDQMAGGRSGVFADSEAPADAVTPDMIAKAMDEFDAWRADNRIALKNMAARAIYKMVDSPYKRAHLNGKSAETVDLFDALAMDSGLASIANALGRTIGASVAQRAVTWMGYVHRLRNFEDEFYTLYLGYPSVTRIADVPIQKSFYRRTKTGQKAMSVEEFKRRATYAAITGTEDSVDEINRYAAEISNFFKVFEIEGQNLGVLGWDAKRIQTVIDDLKARIRSYNETIDSLNDDFADRGLTWKQREYLHSLLERRHRAERNLVEWETIAETPLVPKNESQYFSRIFTAKSIRENPLTFKRIIREWFEDNPKVTLWDEKKQKFETVALDPKNLDKRVDEFYERLLSEADDVATVGGPGLYMRRTLQIPNEKLIQQTGDNGQLVDFIETDPLLVASSYAQRVGSYLEYSRRWGDNPAGPDAGFDDALATAKQAEMEAWKGDRESFLNHWAKMERDAKMLRDRVLLRLKREPGRWDQRMAEILRNFAHLAFMGMSAISAIPDAGKIVMAHGLADTQRFAFLRLGSDTAKLFEAARAEAMKAGALTDVALGTALRHFAEVGTDPLYLTKPERWLRAGVNRFFIANGLAPLTYSLRSLDGAIRQHKLIESMLKLADGKATPEERTFLARYGINDAWARRVKTQFDEGRIDYDKDHDIYFANTDAWTDFEAVQTFRAALTSGIDNTILIASSADKPAVFDGVLHFPRNGITDRLGAKHGLTFTGRTKRVRNPEWEEWTLNGKVGDAPDMEIEVPDGPGYWRVQSGMFGLPFQFWNFGIAAMNKITAAGLENPTMRTAAGTATMVGLGYIAFELKTPDWASKNMALEDKLVRVVDQSGITGLLTDMAYMSQDIVGAGTGANILPIDYKYGRRSTPAEALFDAAGAGPSLARNFALGVGETVAGVEGGPGRLKGTLPLQNFPFVGGLYSRVVDATEEMMAPSPGVSRL